ncbi:hypothetical protein Syun_007494 [Stephania yunnanensis]|uniref:Uncharacterized protein n=1 Tax=Stephania yunnanensis TaxID=152371 RepID=A0AAP0PYS1_9MAGN
MDSQRSQQRIIRKSQSIVSVTETQWGLPKSGSSLLGTWATSTLLHDIAVLFNTPYLKDREKCGETSSTDASHVL